MLPPLIADVNIASRVVQFLRSRGVDVVSGLNLFITPRLEIAIFQINGSKNARKCLNIHQYTKRYDAIGCLVPEISVDCVKDSELN